MRETQEIVKHTRYVTQSCQAHTLCKESLTSASFLIDLQSMPYGDLTADGNGKWMCQGVRRLLFTPSKDGLQSEGVVKSNYIPQGEEIVLVRRYWVHTQNVEFFRRTFHALDSTNRPVNNVAILQYCFVNSEDPVTLTSHGNSKSGQPYSKIKPSIRNKLAQKSLTQMAQQACIEVIEENGGIENVAVNEIPSRNLIYNMKRRKHTGNNDEWEALKDGATEQGKGYLRRVEEYPHPLVVLATDEQLSELERFTTSECENCVDPTFGLGKFHVTPISYKHLCLQNSAKDSNNPVMIGPILIHFSKVKNVYKTFFETLLQERPGLRALRAYGTDGETALIDALQPSFPRALGLRCFRHFQHNVNDYLQHHGLHEFERQFTEDIFGSEKTVGLLDVTTVPDFVSSLENLTTVWDIRDPQGVFSKYITRQSDMLKNNMIAAVRTQAGLGKPPSKFYTNQAESVNFRIKCATKFKETGLLAFIQTMWDSMRAQEEETKLAFCNISKKCVVRSEFKEQLLCTTYFSLPVHKKK